MSTEQKNIEIHKLIVGTFETEMGKRLLEHLKATLVDRPVYVKGISSEEVAYREGQRNVVMQLLKEIKG